ncbi:MAG: diguanylate cyclase [Myxococcales bacterium]|nr:diguanylate cyclase [Myxococcales bacterium]
MNSSFDPSPDALKTRVSEAPEIHAEQQSSLVIVYGRPLGQLFAIGREAVSIGRGMENSIILDSDTVSRRHARIERTSEGFRVEDLGSTNGTFVNDCELEPSGLLRNQDLLRVGSVIFKFLQGGDVETLFHEEIYRMTIVDGLTQIHNKRYFLEMLDRELARSIRHKRPLSLVRFCVDGFDALREEHGGLAADLVLARLAEVISVHVRKEEVFARQEGADFGLLLPETMVDRAISYAEKLRAWSRPRTFVSKEHRSR